MFDRQRESENPWQARKTRQARAIPKTMTGMCDSEKPGQERAILKNHDMHVRFRKTTTGTCDSEKPRQARVIPKFHIFSDVKGAFSIALTDEK